jgi:hypothetical protein
MTCFISWLNIVKNCFSPYNFLLVARNATSILSSESTSKARISQWVTFLIQHTENAPMHPYTHAPMYPCTHVHVYPCTHKDELPHISVWAVGERENKTRKGVSHRPLVSVLHTSWLLRDSWARHAKGWAASTKWHISMKELPQSSVFSRWNWLTLNPV